VFRNSMEKLANSKEKLAMFLNFNRQNVVGQ